MTPYIYKRVILKPETIKEIASALNKDGVVIVKGLGRIEMQKTKHPVTGKYIRLNLSMGEEIKGLLS